MNATWNLNRIAIYLFAILSITSTTCIAQDSDANNQPTTETNFTPALEEIESASSDLPQVESPIEAAVPVSSEVLDLTFDDIKFDMEVGEEFQKSMLTPEIKDLNKREIRIRGFIKPSFKQTGLTKFVLVRDNQTCCFGPTAALYDCVLVELASGKETEFTIRPIAIRGTFYFKSYKGPDGNIWAIYRMKDVVIE